MADSTKQRFVYGLVDPREPEVIRYVGCTDDLARRMLQHLWQTRYPDALANIPKFFFILYLLLDGLRPAMVILETVPAGEDWVRREEHWIRFYRSPMLTNFEKPPYPPDDGVRRESYPTRAGFWKYIQ